MDITQAETITNIILENNFNNILELGFAHGVSSSYMAGALDELGSGKKLPQLIWKRQTD